MHVNADMAVTPKYYALSIGLLQSWGVIKKTITLWISHRTKIECLSRKINIVLLVVGVVAVAGTVQVHYLH